MNYHYNKHINFSAANKTVTLMLQSFFNPKNVLIGTPVFLVNQGGKQVTVQLSYYLGPNSTGNQTFHSNTAKTINVLTNALTHVYESVTGQSVTVQLELVRQHRPYMDASILAQYVAVNASSPYGVQGFNRIANVLLSTVPYLSPDYSFNLSTITGVKVQLSGLLSSQRNRSRNSVYTASAGTFHSSSLPAPQGGGGLKGLNEAPSNILDEGKEGKSQVVVDYGTYTSKSRLGAFTVKV